MNTWTRVGVGTVLMLATSPNVRSNDVFDPYARRPLPIHDVEDVASDDTWSDYAFGWQVLDETGPANGDAGAASMEPLEASDEDLDRDANQRWVQSVWNSP